MTVDEISSPSSSEFYSHFIQSFTEGLHRAFEQPSLTWSLTIPCPSIPLIQSLSLFQGDTTQFYFISNESSTWICSGNAITFSSQGMDAISSVRRQAEIFFTDLRSITYAHVKTPSPRLFGAFGFSTTDDLDPIWQDFNHGFFFLPTWVYGQEGSHSWLQLNVCPDKIQQTKPNYIRITTQKMKSIFSQLLQPSSCPVVTPEHNNVFESLKPLSFDHWQKYLEKIHSAMQSSYVQKVVAARRTIVTMKYPLNPKIVLQKLLSEQPGTTRFFFQHNSSTFLGATPETLITKKDLVIQTEALAGSIAERPHSNIQAAKLLQSGKDRYEHRLVVDYLVDLLSKDCSSLQIPTEPGIKQLRQLLHLHTPLVGHLHDPKTHILELVKRLHPTPALGGYPTPEALEIIHKYEPHSRGLYAGPIGWFDQEGNGHFSVAIRSALIKGKQAYLFTGAGIVQESDPHKEYEETTLKLQTILQALS